MNKHEIAQEYEFSFTKKWIDLNYHRLMYSIKSNKDFLLDPEESQIEWRSEFFDGDKNLFIKIANNVKDKKCMEIGAGACGALAQWTWIKDRVIIDPLLNKTNTFLLSEYGETWYADDIEQYSQVAEKFIPSLENKVDGLIVCRNVLDHVRAPYTILDNIGRYAASDSYLLLWNDLWHLEGPDQGHFNITKDKGEWREYIETLGYDILKEHEHEKTITINYGCLAIKD